MSFMRYNDSALVKEIDRHWLSDADRERLAARVREFPITKAVALRLCGDIRRQQLRRWDLPQTRRCSACVKNSMEGIPARLIPGRPGDYYYGCPAVNRRYLKESAGLS